MLRRYSWRTATPMISINSGNNISRCRFVSSTAVATQSLEEFQKSQELSSLWGDSSNSFIQNQKGATEFLARIGYDPVLSSRLVETSAINTTHEDALGTDLLSRNEKLRAESEALWRGERGSQFLAALRRARARGAGNSVGLARASTSSQEAADEADRAETTWGRDSSFNEIAAAVHAITGVSPTNMEMLLTALKRATPEQLVQLYSNRGLQPYWFLPVPCDAGWALSSSSGSGGDGDGGELSQWCENISKARIEAEKFVDDKLRTAVATSGWPQITAKLVEQHKKLCLVLKERRIRLKQNDWNRLSVEEREKISLQDAQRAIRSETSGEFDAAGDEDTSEEFLLEHEKIEKIIDEDIIAGGGGDGSGITYRLFWLHGERLENLQVQHLSRNVTLRAACICRARDDLSYEAVEADLQKSIADSTFDSRGGFIVPSTSPRGWIMMNWYKFGASNTVVQHSPSSSRILSSRFQTLIGSSAVASLWYRLQPLSSSLDLSSPFRHRRSLVSIASEFQTEVMKSGQARANIALDLLDNTRKEFGSLVNIIASPLGSSRRQVFNSIRGNASKNDVPIENITLHQVSSSSNKNKQQALSSASSASSGSISSWSMGAVNEISFKWTTPLLDGDAIIGITGNQPPSSPEQALAREKARQQRTCITATLFRKRSKEEIEKSVAEIDSHIATLQKIISNDNNDKDNSSSSNSTTNKKSAVEHILRQLRSISSPIDGGNSSLNLENFTSQALTQWKKEAIEWEFVTMLDDNIQITPGTAEEGKQSFRVRMPFLSSSSSSQKQDQQQDFRVELRAFDLQANPNRFPTRFVSGVSTSFKINDVVPEILKNIGKAEVPSTWIQNRFENANTNNQMEKSKRSSNFKGNSLIAVCSALRAQNIEIPLMLEFECGQNLTLKGEINTDHMLDLLTGLKGRYFSEESGANRGLTQVQLACEAAIRRNYEAHHPGLTQQEWAESRRAVLERAMRDEFEWWRQDSVLQLAPESLSPVASPSEKLTFQTVDATWRYARDIVQVLHATGRDGIQEDSSFPIANVSVRGDGATVGLDINQRICTEKRLSLEQVLGAVKSASNAAHVHLNTLSESKIGLTQAMCHRLWIENADSSDLGGIFSQGVVRNFDRARRDISSSSSSTTTTDVERKRLSEQDEDRSTATDVDRFPSKDNMELRRKLFDARIGPMGENLDEKSVDNTDPWMQ